MTNAIAVLAAYIICCNGIHIFREPNEVGPGPLLSSYIFMFGASLLLYDLTIYPQSLRKMGFIMQNFVEFILSTFLLENIMMDFWFPLEIAMMAMPSKLSDMAEELLQTGEWTCEAFCDFLRNESTGLLASYISSTNFLILVLHAIRAIDLRALQEGPGCFFGDISYRFRRFIKKKMKIFGIGGKRRVRIYEENQLNRSKPRSTKSMALCRDDVEDDTCPCDSDFDM